jgi:branched-chain amino acid transport system substrate-binding protein
MKRLALLAALLLPVPVALASASGDPGVTSTTVLLGGTVPLSGPASAFGAVGPGAKAYFDYVNDRGGVAGRKIQYTYLDDGYDPGRTVNDTRQLISQSKVFAIFNSVGTEHNEATAPILNQLGIPQLFVGSGARGLAKPKRTPWTLGYLPSFYGEGAIYGRWLAAHSPKARIAVLYESSDYGKDLLAGLRKGLGRRVGNVKATQPYDVTDPEVSSQIARLKASKASVLMVFATPKFTIQSFSFANRLGWKPRFFISAVSIEPTIMQIATAASSRKETEGAISTAFLKNPDDRIWQKDATVRLYKRIMKQYAPGADVSNVYHYYGMAVAYTLVDALRHAGRNLTRATLLRAATHLNERNPFMLPGIRIQTSPSDYYPIAKTRLYRYHLGRWVSYGPLVPARG